MKTFLKYFGLAVSSMLTVSLFIDLYGATAYGIIMALLALSLFEAGAIAWSALMVFAKGGQRGIVKACQWFCVAASVVSSCVQIILSTNLWEPGFDIGFATLLIICAALAVNVFGVFAYEQLDPSRHEINRELDRQAKAREAAAKLEDRVIEQSLIKAESKVAEIAGQVSDALSNELRGDVVTYLLAHTRGGNNSLPAPKREADLAALEEAARFFDVPARGNPVELPRSNGHDPKAKG